jgi:transposase-like protein
MHKTKIQRQVDEVKGEIKTIGEEAKGRLSASHKLFQRALSRLEKKYDERLERLLQQFESTIAQETRGKMKPDLPIEVRTELKELLDTRLKARGLEIAKAFKRQVELYDLEHARFIADCAERIEAVHATSKDSFEQQLKTMNAEIERMLKGFKIELSQLNLQMPQIKDAGHAAALAVSAYNRARLSFGPD